MMNDRDKWVKSARLYIHDESEWDCECDCFLCIRGEHDEHCEEPLEEWEEILSS